MISFEIVPEKNSNPYQVELFVDEEGLDYLLSQLMLLKSVKNDHTHLFAEEWGGYELRSKVWREGNCAVRHVKIIKVSSP